MPFRCYQSQNYKIWKQFTTKELKVYKKLLLLSIAKLQNLKAIHNLRPQHLRTTVVVINHKTTKFESNSQQRWTALENSLSCYQSQNYKIWKQFTTYEPNTLELQWLLSITKLQNLKAIHNSVGLLWKTLLVVINHKTTKFESNSQPTSPTP